MKGQLSKQNNVVFTIGHSTRPVSELIEMIRAYGIKNVVDVRTIPKSRHNPQFNNDALKESLKAVEIGYLHTKGLGGLRHALKDSPNTGWRNASFRGFAGYMQTEEFKENLGKLIEKALRKTTVIICAEALPWRCHRSLIGYALLVSGIQVRHIMSSASSRSHTLTPWAKVNGGQVTYPPNAGNRKL